MTSNAGVSLLVRKHLIWVDIGLFICCLSLLSGGLRPVCLFSCVSQRRNSAPRRLPNSKSFISGVHGFGLFGSHNCPGAPCAAGDESYPGLNMALHWVVAKSCEVCATEGSWVAACFEERECGLLPNRPASSKKKPFPMAHSDGVSTRDVSRGSASTRTLCRGRQALALAMRPGHANRCNASVRVTLSIRVPRLPCSSERFVPIRLSGTSVR